MRLRKIQAYAPAISADFTRGVLGTTQITTADDDWMAFPGIVVCQVFAKLTCASNNDDSTEFIHGHVLPCLVSLPDISNHDGNDKNNAGAVGAPGSPASGQCRPWRCGTRGCSRHPPRRNRRA